MSVMLVDVSRICEEVSNMKLKNAKTYRVYFKDGNQRLYESINMLMLCQYIEANSIDDTYGAKDIVKIEEEY